MFYNVKIFKTNMLMPYWCRFHSGKLTVDLCFLEELIQIQAEQPFHQGYQVLIKFIKAFLKNIFLNVYVTYFFLSQKGLTKTAVETVQYLEKRKNFWRQTVEKNE